MTATATSTASSASNAYAQSVYESLNGKSKTTATSKTADQQSQFLTLLSTQLKNQDPLNPMDNAQMTSQLAQISTVDGIERLNATLKTMLSNSSTSQTLQAAGLVGQEVLVPGSAVTLASGTAAAGLELESGADRVTVTITDSSGLTVRTIELGAQSAGLHTYSWDGKNNAGAAVVDGDYKVSIKASKGTNEVAATRLQYGLVNSVSSNGSSVSLNVGGLGSFGIADVRQIL